MWKPRGWKWAVSCLSGFRIATGWSGRDDPNADRDGVAMRKLVARGYLRRHAALELTQVI